MYLIWIWLAFLVCGCFTDRCVINIKIILITNELVCDGLGRFFAVFKKALKTV